MTRRRSGTTCGGETAISLYLDSSVVVAALTKEPFTAAAQAWLRGQDATELCGTTWMAAEVHAAFAAKLRRRLIDEEARARALLEWETFQAALTLLPISDFHFRRTARLCDQHELGLRAPDALHLAVCELGDHTLCTFDKTLAHAAEHVGVATVWP